MKPAMPRSRYLAAFVAIMALLLAGAGAGFAQDATPSAHVPHPAHIHSGTCTELGDVVYPLTDVGAPDASATPDAMAGHDMSSMDATPGADDDGMTGHDMAEDEKSVTDVDAALDDILAEEHAINVHESMENIGNYIACGELTGTPEDGELTVELAELNDSGYSGEAVLVDNGDGTTTVTVTLTSTGADSGATPSASGGSDEVGTYEVMIEDFAYSPAELTIKAGESVTFTNQDTAPHTATARDRDILQTGRLDQGESVTVTFDTPGTYEYFCEFHPDMKGVIVVEE